ncbi:MAG: Hpt domain-containing protein, partial [Spongiibacteraceae bacterium]
FIEEATAFEFIDDAAIPYAAVIDVESESDVGAAAAESASVEPETSAGPTETSLIELSEISVDLQEPPLIDDIVIAPTSTAWMDTAADDSDAESDRMLLEIFTSEAATHLESLDTFIRNTLERFGFAELDDNLQRALHTLKGSAHMAGVGPIAEIVTPIEHLVKELRAAQLRTDDEVLELLEAASVLLHRGLDQLSTTPFAPIAGADDWEARVALVYHAKLDHSDDTENTGGADDVYSPAQLGQFLGDAIELISAVADDLALWRTGNLPDERHTTLAATIAQVADNAEALNIGAVTDLAQSFQSLLRRNAHIALPEPDFFDLSALAADHLIDMLDRLAANQETGADDALLTLLQDYEPDEFDAPALAAPADFAPIEPLLPERAEPPLLENIVEFVSAADGAAAGIEAEEQPSSDTAAAFEATVEPTAENADSTRFTNLVDVPEPLIELAPVAPELDQNFSEGMAPATIDTAATDDFDLMAAAAQLDTLHTDDTTDETDDFLATEGLVDFDALEGETVDLDAAFAATPPPQQHSSIASDVVNEYLEAFAQADSTPPLFAAPPLPTLAADDNDSSDEEIDAEILEIFLEEAADLLEGLDETLHAWNNDRTSPRHLDELQRLLHTLKGGARLAGLKNLGNLAHNFETLLINTQQQQRVIDDPLLTQVHGYQDQLVRMVDAVKAGGHHADADVEIAPADEFVSEAVATVEPEPIETDTPAGSDEFDESPESFEGLDDLETADGVIVPFVRASNPRSAGEFLATPLGAEVEDLPDMAANALLRRGTGPQEVVKISAQLLEQLVNLAGETSIARSRSEEQVNEFVFALDEMQITVDRLQEQVRRLDSETEAQVISRQEQFENVGMEGFDPLEFDRYSLLQQLSRSLLESASDLIDIKNTLTDKSRDMETLLVQQARINTELQEGLMRSRMVPFARMVPRLRRIVRQIAGELGKQVDFLVDNAEGELDRTVLERIVAPLEHMLRNAVDHGIESPADRIAHGKSARGTILLSLAREGSEIALRLSDDGRGIDLNAVRHKAVDRGLMASSANLSDHEVLQFILESGFSTAKQITQISGRGVGMDVVASEIKQLGGALEIDSVWGNGTRFTVRLPFTVSVNRALMVNVAGDIYAIPLNSIEGIVRVSPFELEAYYQPEAPLFEYAGQPYQMRYMGGLLHSGDRPVLEGQTMPLPVLLVRGTDHSVAVQVDGLMGSREIVVKTLGPQFGMVHGLSGATVLGDGSVVVILDLMAMIRADAMHLHRDLALSQDDTTPDRSRPQLVMVVDDSVTVRKVTSRFLERQGMEVMLAKDGVDAISLLQESDRVPDVMLLDIEMPRMDGFEVASRIRHSSRWQDLPIIMITSRTGEKHRERAFSLGVNRYLGKPYQEMVLLETIYELTGTTAPL